MVLKVCEAKRFTSSCNWLTTSMLLLPLDMLRRQRRCHLLLPLFLLLTPCFSYRDAAHRHEA